MALAGTDKTMKEDTKEVMQAAHCSEETANQIISSMKNLKNPKLTWKTELNRDDNTVHVAETGFGDYHLEPRLVGDEVLYVLLENTEDIFFELSCGKRFCEEHFQENMAATRTSEKLKEDKFKAFVLLHYPNLKEGSRRWVEYKELYNKLT